MQHGDFFSHLWLDYIRVTPQAARIHALFTEQGDKIVNDHVAFRTFNLSPISIADLEPRILELGYRRFEFYNFEEKKLNAWAYLPEEEMLPRIFFSELLVERLSPNVQSIIRGLVAQVPERVKDHSDVFRAGRLWEMPEWSEYQCLMRESEYAAWLSVMGLRANHFTISINHLQNDTIQHVIEKLQTAGFALNEAGGLIKGTPGMLLEQASTMADSVDMTFADGDAHQVKTCYYEFAKRYRDNNGELYQGFVPANANNIFHSTDSR